MASKVPDAVRRAREEAEKIQAELTGTSQETSEQEVNEASELPQPQEVKTVEQPQEVEAPGEAQPALTAADYELLQQRYATAQGMLAAQGRQIKELEAALDELRQRLSAPSPEPAPAETSSEDVEMFGEELVQMVQRQARLEAERQAQMFAEKIRALEAALGDTSSKVAATAQERFERRLSELVPNWQTLNTNPRWHEWLSRPDPLSGIVRQELLNDAAAKLDPDRVAQFFRSWMAEAGMTSQPQQSQQPDGLSRYVEPNGAATVAAQASQVVRPITLDQLSEMASSIVKLRRSDPQRAAELQRQMDAAIREGRVQAS